MATLWSMPLHCGHAESSVLHCHYAMLDVPHLHLAVKDRHLTIRQACYLLLVHCLHDSLAVTVYSLMQVICVSHTSKENTVLRACVSPYRVWVIPNGKVREM